jgi:hypothetical protein
MLLEKRQRPLKIKWLKLRAESLLKPTPPSRRKQMKSKLKWKLLRLKSKYRMKNKLRPSKTKSRT